MRPAVGLLLFMRPVLPCMAAIKKCLTARTTRWITRYRCINNKKSPIQDEYIEKYLAEKELDLTATLDAKEALLLICGVISIVIQVASFLYGEPVQKHVIQTFRIWTWLFYFLLGAEMKTLKVWISAHISVVSHFLLCIGVTIIIIAFENYVGCKKILEITGALHAEYFYDSPCEMFWIALIFSFLLRIDFSGSVSKYITGLASLTMGIYIVHPLILRITVKIIGNTSIFRSIVYWLVTTLCAVVITWIIKKLPFGECLIKI